MARIKEVLQGMLGEDSIEYLAQHYPSMQLLTNLTAEEIAAIPGVTRIKAKQLALAIRVGRACLEPEPVNLVRVCSPGDVYTNFKHMGLLEEEHFYALYLNTKNVVLAHRLISKGSLNTAVVHPREVFAHAVRLRAASVLVVHNHPSGDPAPSQDDISITKRLKESGNILGIELLDHIVIGGVGFLSFKERGLM